MSLPPTDISPADFLGRAVRSYSTLKFYQDEGIVVVNPGSEDQLEYVSFTTMFARPSNFKFSWMVSHPLPSLAQLKVKNALTYDGVRAFIWRDYGEYANQVCEATSFESAIAYSTGTSLGASGAISRLLFQNVVDAPFRDLSACHFVGVELLDDAWCYQVVGESRMGQQRFWIGAEDFLIRRYRTIVNGRVHEERRRVAFNSGGPRIEEFDLP